MLRTLRAKGNKGGKVPGPQVQDFIGYSERPCRYQFGDGFRLSIAFDTSAESWLNQQAQYNLWLAPQNQQEFKVERLLAA